MKFVLIAALISLCYAQPKVALEGDLMHFDPAIAMFCGKNNQHRSLATGEWITDTNGDSDCLGTAAEVLDYCHKVYPSMEFTDVTEENNKEFVHHWCKIGHKGPTCKGHSHSVTPYKCIVAPMKKQEEKVSKVTIPESVIDAAQPVDEPLDEVCSQPKVVGFCRAAFHRFHYDITMKQCTHFIYGGCGGNDNNFETMEDCVDKCGGTYPDVPKKGGKYPNFGLPMFNNLGPVIDTIDVTESTTESTTTTTEATTTTTTTEATPVSTTFHMDVDISPLEEDEQYIKSIQEEQTQHDGKLSQTMQEFNTANMNLGLNMHVNPKAVKKQRKQLKKKLDKTIQMLKEQHKNKLDQMHSAHLAKKDSILNGQNKLDGVMSQANELLNEQSIIIDEGGLPAEMGPDETEEELEYYEEEEDIENYMDDNDEDDDNEDEDLDVDEDLDEDDDLDSYKDIDEQLNGDEIELLDEEEFGEAVDYPVAEGVGAGPEKKSICFNVSEASATKWILVGCGAIVLVAFVAFVARTVTARKQIMKKQRFTRLQVNDHLTPEERQLLAMQQNGYENPTYKFFEKQQMA